tara:strand:- start:127 stop:444 length:318 start_codon:yes stop_codon:yes gene_type:complete
MKYFKLLILLNLILLIASCSTVNEGFKNQRKENSDEFLVEKKSPLVMPPDYDELPIPSGNQDILNDDNSIKSLISTGAENNDISDNNSKKNKNFEKSLIEKINNK